MQYDKKWGSYQTKHTTVIQLALKCSQTEKEVTELSLIVVKMSVTMT